MRKRLLLLVCCVLSTMMAIAQSRTNPEVADYFIKGYLSIERGSNGKPVYKLSNISKSGISFDDPGLLMLGAETTQEDVMFQFTHYATNYVGGISTPLDFWRFDKSINEWQPDVETRQGNAGVQEKKSMVLMLVLDCSSSLQNDFSFVQEAAKSFIKSMLDASGKGNVKIGIVAFSKISETEFFPITSLTNDSYYDMCRFINSRNVQNGTALYYAMDKAIDDMESYCNTSIPANEPLYSAMMVTFTDGLDQTSRDEDRGIYTADNYYIELQRKMNNKRINGIPLQSKMRGVRGVDIATDAQLGKFSQIGNSLADFKLLNNVSELGQEFKYIAQSLINEWAVLNCYVPNSFEGEVAWTYPSRKQVTNPKETIEKGNLFWGINAGIGIRHREGDGLISTDFFGISSRDFSFDYTHITGSIGLDLAFPINKSVNLGVYSSFGYAKSGNSWSQYDLTNSLTFGGGPLILINFQKSGSLYFGSGIHSDYDLRYLDFDGIGFEMRLGYKFRNGLYIFIEDNIFSGRFTGSYYDPGDNDNYNIDCTIKRNSALLHIGYSF